jgi:hypothetical protein
VSGGRAVLLEERCACGLEFDYFMKFNKMDTKLLKNTKTDSVVKRSDSTAI